MHLYNMYFLNYDNLVFDYRNVNEYDDNTVNHFALMIILE